jgi:predicted transposase YdaD
MPEPTSADMNGGWKQIIEDYLAETREKSNMPYVTSIERNALQRGIEQGRQEGQQEGMLQGVRDILRQTVAVRFGALPESLSHKIDQCQDVAALRAFQQQALTARSMDELQF